MSTILLNIGAISGIWGLFWRSWDRNAIAPGWLLGIALVCFGIGEVML